MHVGYATWKVSDLTLMVILCENQLDATCPLEAYPLQQLSDNILHLIYVFFCRVIKNVGVMKYMILHILI